jgi:hypothetical protein
MKSHGVVFVLESWYNLCSTKRKLLVPRAIEVKSSDYFPIKLNLLKGRDGKPQPKVL